MLKTIFILFSFTFWGIYFYNESNVSPIVEPITETDEASYEEVQPIKEPASIKEEKKTTLSKIDQLMMDKLGFVLDISSVSKLNSKEEIISFIEQHTSEECFLNDSKIRCTTKTDNCLLEKEKTSEETSFCASLRSDCIKDTENTNTEITELANHLHELSKENLKKSQKELKEYIANNSRIKECEHEKDKKEEHCELVSKDLCINLENEKTEIEETPIQSYYCLTKNIEHCILEN